MCVAQPRLYSYIFHPHKHVLTCECPHQDCSIHIKRIHVHKLMRNKIHIYAYIRIHIKCTQNNKNDQIHMTIMCIFENKTIVIITEKKTNEESK